MPSPPDICRMNDNLPLVTVVTATFNLVKNERVESFRQCVESVHAQDYPNIEHLVIDGASSDGTLDIIREYEQKGWLSCYSEPDKGIYDAMNKGIRLAKGKYIAFLNSDDLWHGSDGVSKTVDILEVARGDMSCGPAKIVTEEGVFMHYWGAMPAIFFSRITFNHQTSFARTELMRELGGFDSERYRIVADYDFITRALMRGAKPVYVPNCFTTFKMGGISSDIPRFEQEMHEVHRHNFSRFIGEAATRDMYAGKMPASLYRLILSMVHPIVAEELKQIVEQDGEYAVLNREVSHSYTSYKDCILKDSFILAQDHREEIRCGTEYRMKLLLVLPFRFEQRGEMTKFTFLGIPLFTIRQRRDKVNKSESKVYRLFGFIPFYRHVNRGEGRTRKYYFLGLPVLKISSRG